MTMKLGTIFALNEYAEAYKFISENGYTIEEVEAVDGVRQFKIVEIPQPSEAELKQSRIAELESYLASTDWYAIRESETGIDIPADIKQARADARTEISTLRGDI